MGRPKTPIVMDGPAATFAAELRSLRIAAGWPTYRHMAQLSSWSYNGLAQADRGHRLPTWACTQAYLSGCGVEETPEIEAWRRKWESARRAIQMRNELALLQTQAPPGVRRQRLPRTRRLDLPEMHHASTMDELVTALRKAIEQHARTPENVTQAVSDPGLSLPFSAPPVDPPTLHAVLAGHRRPTLTLVLRVVAACGGTHSDLGEWFQAWTRIKNAEEHAQETLQDLRKQAEQILEIQEAVSCEPKEIELRHKIITQARLTAEALLRATRMVPDSAATGRTTEKVSGVAPPGPDDHGGQSGFRPRGHVGKHRQERTTRPGPSPLGMLFGLWMLS